MLASTEALAIQIANDEHAGAIVQLVNHAYRSKLINKGWSNESELVSGNRIDTDTVLSLIHQPDSTILLAIQGDKAIACAHLKKSQKSIYLGMLSVAPQLQGMGIGKQLLNQVEDYAWNKLSAESIIIDVISQRAELISFYQRRGYQLQGAAQDYPLHMNVGQPMLKGLTVQQLVKKK